MTDVREKWVAFPDAAEMTDGQIIVGYAGLPAGLDPDRLQINANALERGVIGWGGYSALTLAAYKGDEDNYAFGAGTDASGNAYAIGSATVAKAESSQLIPASDVELNARDVRNGSLGIQWNINALNSRIEAHEQFDPAIRAKQISHEIRKNAIQGVLRHNTIDVLDNRPRILNTVFAGLDGWFLSDLISPVIQKDYGQLTERLVMRSAYMGGLIRGMRAGFLNPDTTFRDNITDLLFWTGRPTRAAIGAGVLASSRLVRATPLSKLDD